MTSWSEESARLWNEDRAPGIVPDPDVTELPVPELRSGTWTRLGSPELLGDAVTEQALGSLAEATRSAARAQGYAAGWAEGRRESAREEQRRAEEEARAAAAQEARREAEHRAALSSLQTAAAGLEAAVAQVCARIEEQASRLAVELVRELLGHELRLETDADAIARVLEVLPDGPAAQVRLHPAQSAAATAELRARGARVVPDPTLSLGDAVVEATDHVVELRLDDALTRLAVALETRDPDRSHLAAVRR